MRINTEKFLDVLVTLVSLSETILFYLILSDTNTMKTSTGVHLF